MQRPVCALLLAISAGGLAVAACGSLEDERPLCTEDSDPSECGRPLTVEYLTLQIFAPSCGLTQCHSRFRRAGDLVFDNPHDTRLSLLIPNSGPLIKFTSEQFDPRDFASTAESNLIKWLLPLNEVNQDVGRMPFDSPLPAIDIQLLRVWMRKPPIVDGAQTESGEFARGAQCNPDLYGGLACNDNDIVTCNADFNFGEPVRTCAGGCQITEPCIEADPDDPIKCREFGPAVTGCRS